MATKHILILGAGYGGLQAAKSLHKNLRKRDDVKISLIDQNDYHTLLTELHEVAGHGLDPHGVKVSIEHVLEYTKVDFIKDRIIGADLKEKKLYSEKAQYDFDYLIIGVGSEPAYFNIEGMEDYSLPLWSLEDARKIQRHINHMFQLAVEEEDPKRRSEMLTL